MEVGNETSIKGGGEGGAHGCDKERISEISVGEGLKLTEQR